MESLVCRQGTVFNIRQSWQSSTIYKQVFWSPKYVTCFHYYYLFVLLALARSIWLKQYSTICCLNNSLWPTCTTRAITNDPCRAQDMIHLILYLHCGTWCNIHVTHRSGIIITLRGQGLFRFANGIPGLILHGGTEDDCLRAPWLLPWCP